MCPGRPRPPKEPTDFRAVADRSGPIDSLGGCYTRVVFPVRLGSYNSVGAGPSSCPSAA